MDYLIGVITLIIITYNYLTLLNFLVVLLTVGVVLSACLQQMFSSVNVLACTLQRSLYCSSFLGNEEIGGRTLLDGLGLLFEKRENRVGDAILFQLVVKATDYFPAKNCAKPRV